MITIKIAAVCMAVCAQLLKYAQLFVTLGTIAHQAPLSMGAPGNDHGGVDNENVWSLKYEFFSLSHI